MPQSPACEEYPFVLTTVRSEGQFNTIVYEDVDVYRQTQSRWCVMIGDEDLSRLGLSVHDRVDLHSAYGAMRNVLVERFDLPAGDLMAYFPEANILTGTAVDPRSKTPAFKATPVRIEVRKSTRL
jgi:anaerobic selenocysteine-containing dehydrogenase